jgi:hypothetical protein
MALEHGVFMRHVHAFDLRFRFHGRLRSCKKEVYGQNFNILYLRHGNGPSKAGHFNPSAKRNGLA